MKPLIGWLSLSLSAILVYSPRFVRVGIAWFLTVLWFDVLRIRRKVVLNNIAIAFPEWPRKTSVRVARKALWHWAMSVVDYSFMGWIGKPVAEDIFEFRNRELVERVLARGKGCLIMTLHMGNGDLVMAGLAHAGVPIAVVSKEFKAKWLNEMWWGLRQRLGVTLIPARNSSFALLKSLKRNQAVVIPLDQFTGPPIGVRTTFFGKETGTAAGLAIMAQRSGAGVVSAYVTREPDGKNVVHFIREMSAVGEVEAVTQSFNDELETFVRLHPDQWMWLHKRWKRFVDTQANRV